MMIQAADLLATTTNPSEDQIRPAGDRAAQMATADRP
jgi:hypothetical protein